MFDLEFRMICLSQRDEIREEIKFYYTCYVIFRRKYFTRRPFTVIGRECMVFVGV